MSNTYEFGLSTRKSDVKLTSDYYLPVINGENSQILYIVKTSAQPNFSGIVKQADFTGLLQSPSAIPDKIHKAFDETFPNAQYLYLDSTYRPQPMIVQLKDLTIFLVLLLAGLGLRLALTRSGKTQRVVQEQAEKST